MQPMDCLPAIACVLLSGGSMPERQLRGRLGLSVRASSARWRLLLVGIDDEWISHLGLSSDLGNPVQEIPTLTPALSISSKPQQTINKNVWNVFGVVGPGNQTSFTVATRRTL